MPGRSIRAETPAGVRRSPDGRGTGAGGGDLLEAATWGYLALPLVLFLATWLRWPLGWTALAGIALATARAFPAGSLLERRARTPPRAHDLLREGCVLAAVGAVIALNGVGGSGVQTWDWLKHTAILRDLIDAPWPVLYDVDGERAALVYYLAWYLPAALVGKLLGWVPAHLAQLAWTTAGAWLVVCWLRRLGGARWWGALLLFVFFSGLDAAGAWLHPRGPGAPPAWSDFDLEWWAGWWAYESNVSHLAYAPHQALGGWLLAALLLARQRRSSVGSRPEIPLIALVAAVALWSPFVVLGGLVLVGLDAALRLDLTGRARELATVPSLAATPALVAVTAYFAARISPPALEGYRPDRVAGTLSWTLERGPWATILGLAVLFALLEFLALSVVAWRALDGDPHRRREVAAAAALLLLLPWVSYGYYNDLAIRVSVPALFVLQAGVLRALGAGPGRRGTRLALLALVLLGAVFPANQLRLRAEQVWARRDLVSIPSRQLAPDLFEQQRSAPDGFFFVGQYLASAGAPFFRWLAPSAPPLPVGDSARLGAAQPEG